MKYNIIYADPPWRYADKRAMRGGAEGHYSTMPVKEIIGLGDMVKNMTAENAFLFMWGTWPLLPEMGAVIAAWGFDYKTCAFIWVKTKKSSEVDQAIMFAEDAFDPGSEKFWGCGNYTRSNTEFCLLGVKGKVEVKRHDVHQLIFSPAMRHSEKPNETRRRIVRLCGDLPRIELFARQRFDGWDAWGNEV